MNIRKFFKKENIFKITCHPTFIVFIIFIISVLAANSLYSYYVSDLYPYSDPGIYDRNFFMGVLVNVNSSIVDFFVLGVVVFFIDNFRNNKERLNDSLQRLADYAAHSSIELNLRKLTLLKNALSSGEDVNIDALNLEGITLKNMEFKNQTLTGLNLTGCKLENCIFINCNIKAIILIGTNGENVLFENCKMNETKLIDGKYKFLTFSNCDLEKTKFRKAKLLQTKFLNCNVKDCEYTYAEFERARIENLRNVDFVELVKAANLNYLDADPAFVTNLRVLDSNIRP